ncbi:MAG: OmpA family protein [Thermodesulfovibrionales bacterium]|nr:OmpA family protein [Thermodesulfovibrionales bacterium]
MKNKRRIDEHDNADRWVVSYADFITLLFAFFTTMYAISNVDVGKLERFEGSMRASFKVTDTAPMSRSVIEGIRPINYEALQLEKELKSIFDKFDKIEGVNVITNENGVLLSFADSVLFDHGSSEIKDEAKLLFSSVMPVINKAQHRIIVEGHTDNIPIKSPKYPSNWELSTARATSVLVYFLQQGNVSPERLSASGYGEYRPVASNATPEGRARNRRVDILLTDRKGGG